MWIPMLTYYAERGFVVASVEYRLSHEATFPAPLEDVKTAIRFLRTHAEVFGIDPKKIAIMGESAGAHLAAMAATTHAHHVFEKGACADQDDSVQAAVSYTHLDVYKRQVLHPLWIWESTDGGKFLSAVFRWNRDGDE